MFFRLRSILGRFDWLLLLAVAVLVAVSIASIWSVALSRGNDLGIVTKQGIAAAMGFALIFMLAAANYRLFKNYSLIIVLAAVLMLVAVLIFGTTIRGTTGWLRVAGWNFQPVEFAKFALVVYLAKYLSNHPRASFGLREFLVSGFWVAIITALTLAEPDLGSSLVLLATWVGLLAFARIRKRYLLSLIFGGIAIAILSWFILAPYQKDRILTFMDPARDPLGRGYNVKQAMIAVGAGGLFGRGLGFGSQSQLRFLPESQTDFIFAVIAESFGFAGVLLVLGFLGLLMLRTLRIAKAVGDDFSIYLVVGILLIFAVQSVVNIGMNLGIMPVTGIALPFLSYGGSALLMSLAMVGVVESIAVRRSIASKS